MFTLAVLACVMLLGCCTNSTFYYYCLLLIGVLNFCVKECHFFYFHRYHLKIDYFHWYGYLLVLLPYLCVELCGAFPPSMLMRCPPLYPLCVCVYI